MKTITSIISKVVEFLKKIPVYIKRLPDFLTRFRKIRSQLIVAFLVPIFFIAFQGIINYSNSSKISVSSIQDSSMASMESSGRYLEVIFRTVETMAGQIFSNTDVQNYLKNDFSPDDFEGKRNALQSTLDTLANITSLVKKSTTSS